DGIAIDGAQNNVIQATVIGVDAAALFPIPNGGCGIRIANSSGNTIGGKVAAYGNTIAFNVGDGVRVVSGDSNAIRRNSIYGNLLNGIALQPFANRGVPAPVLTSAITGPGQVRVAGALTGRKNATYTIDIYG